MVRAKVITKYCKSECTLTLSYCVLGRVCLRCLLKLIFWPRLMSLLSDCCLGCGSFYCPSKSLPIPSTFLPFIYLFDFYIFIESYIHDPRSCMWDDVGLTINSKGISNNEIWCKSALSRTAMKAWKRYNDKSLTIKNQIVQTIVFLVVLCGIKENWILKMQMEGAMTLLKFCDRGDSQEYQG